MTISRKKQKQNKGVSREQRRKITSVEGKGKVTDKIKGGWVRKFREKKCKIGGWACWNV
jgi:hypothetical protein